MWQEGISGGGEAVGGDDGTRETRSFASSGAAEGVAEDEETTVREDCAGTDTGERAATGDASRADRRGKVTSSSSQ